jgi:hypothetical protein
LELVAQSESVVPFQVPLAARADCGRSSEEPQMARSATRQGAGLESLETEEPW